MSDIELAGRAAGFILRGWRQSWFWPKCDDLASSVALLALAVLVCVVTAKCWEARAVHCQALRQAVSEEGVTMPQGPFAVPCVIEPGGKGARCHRLPLRA
jgi:hypothetical protein